MNSISSIAASATITHMTGPPRAKRGKSNPDITWRLRIAPVSANPKAPVCSRYRLCRQAAELFEPRGRDRLIGQIFVEDQLISGDCLLRSIQLFQYLAELTQRPCEPPRPLGVALERLRAVHEERLDHVLKPHL